ncbi:MAG: hypothetical protein ACLF0P_09055 [Thermoanaerobaculia bacterium]
MTAIRAFFDGFGRASGAWRLVLLLWLVNLAVAAPFAAAMARALQDSVGHSLVHRNLLERFDTGWHGELQAGAQGVVETFRPEVLGAGAFFDSLERWWTGGLLALPPVLVGTGIVYALVWAFLLGGVIERLHRPGEGAWADRATRAPGFFEACGRHFLRFVRLGIVAAVLYLLVYRLSRAAFSFLEDSLRDVTSERTALLWTLVGAAVTVLLLAGVRVVFDYAKISVVARQRRSALGAAWEGLRLVAARPFATLGLYAAYGLLGAGLLALYASLTPALGQTSGQAGWSAALLALAAGQLAIVVRVGLRLALLGGEVSFFGRARRR